MSAVLRLLLVALALVGADACTKKRTAPIHVVDAAGTKREVDVHDVRLTGDREGRGFAELKEFGSGASVTIIGSSGPPVTLPTTAFEDPHRIFVKRDAGVQLVRFKDGATRDPDQRRRGTGRKHREYWDVLVEDVKELRFSGG